MAKPPNLPLTLGPCIACWTLALVAPKVKVWHTSWSKVVGAKGKWTLTGLASIGCSKGGIPKVASSTALTVRAHRVVFALLKEE